MDKLFEQSLLFDFYGELLTKHQKQLYEDFVLNDYSLSEIATEQGISRQGVHDSIRRTKKILEEYEDKLHLVERFIKTKEDINKICALVEGADLSDKDKLKLLLEDIKNIASDISLNM